MFIRDNEVLIVALGVALIYLLLMILGPEDGAAENGPSGSVGYVEDFYDVPRPEL